MLKKIVTTHFVAGNALIPAFARTGVWAKNGENLLSKCACITHTLRFLKNIFAVFIAKSERSSQYKAKGSKQIQKIIVLLTSVLLLTACNRHSDQNTVRIGTIAGPETQLMLVAKKVALEKYGLNLKIIQFTDYTMPNAALADGSIDANMFQHLPYLQQAIKDHGYKLVSLGKMFIYPMAIYSSKYNALKDIPNNAVVAIPNDPSNGARALLLLQKAGLIKLNNDSVKVSLLNITDNPKKLQFKELDAAQLPRVLSDVALAVINTNYALAANLNTQRALFQENKDSPYANIIVVRQDEQNDPKFKKLVAALHSQAVVDKAKMLFDNTAIKAW